MHDCANRMPAVFVGHGSPMNALEDNVYTRGWRAIAEAMPKPKAVLCVSAHWESRGIFVCAAQAPPTIHDFGGFPQALFDAQYPAPGDPALAHRVATLIKLAHVRPTEEWGLDHGSWSVLKIMYPQADVPVVQLSIDTSQPGEVHYRLGRELAALRDEGVLIMGSGNIVHNLRTLNLRNPAAPEWISRIDATVADRILGRQHADLIDWRRLDPQIALAVPTPEHYLPLLYVLGAQRDDDAVKLFNQGLFSTISMTSVQVG